MPVRQRPRTGRTHERPHDSPRSRHSARTAVIAPRFPWRRRRTPSCWPLRQTSARLAPHARQRLQECTIHEAALLGGLAYGEDHIDREYWQRALWLEQPRSQHSLAHCWLDMTSAVAAVLAAEPPPRGARGAPKRQNAPNALRSVVFSCQPGGTGGSDECARMRPRAPATRASARGARSTRGTLKR